MPPKSKSKAAAKAPVAAKASVAANTRGASNLNHGVPSTGCRRPVGGRGSPSVLGLTGVGSGGGSPTVDACLTGTASGGGTPIVPCLTGAESGGSSIRSDRFRTLFREVLRPAKANSLGGRNFKIEGTSGQRRTLSASSEFIASGSVSRTNIPAQYPPARQLPSAHQRQSLNLNDLPVSRVEVPVHRQRNLRAVDMVEEEQEEQEEEEDYYAEFAEQDPPSEEEDEVDAPFVDAQVVDGHP
ncbi:hypothetical protein AALP_AAs39279U000100 [Arabis alpina]|uniref:Uncharacterized protein n=1 Tax=Arabis alpina TaxID=50452 RepID=A0A087FZ20_ARAAL|nr:hypothetical protein AALP_AAs39279U000100 [Arabis alpina]